MQFVFGGQSARRRAVNNIMTKFGSGGILSAGGDLSDPVSIPPKSRADRFQPGADPIPPGVIYYNLGEVWTAKYQIDR